MLKLDPKDNGIHCNVKHVDVGYVADKYIRKLKNVSELQVQ